MAILMLENSADIRLNQAMLGHADLKSIQIYTHVAVQQLIAIHTTTHPAKTRQQAAEHSTKPGAKDGPAATARQDKAE